MKQTSTLCAFFRTTLCTKSSISSSGFGSLPSQSSPSCTSCTGQQKTLIIFSELLVFHGSFLCKFCKVDFGLCVHQDLPIDNPCLPKTSDKNLVDTWVFVFNVPCTAAIWVCFPSKAKIENIHQLRSVPSPSSSEKRPEQGGWQNRGGDRLPRLGHPLPHPLQPHNSPLSRLPQRSCLPAQARARNKIMLQFYSIRIWSFHNKENVLTPLIKETPN